VHTQEHDMLSKMSSCTGARANYNVRHPTETQIIKGEYYSVFKLLEVSEKRLQICAGVGNESSVGCPH
jgi:hypothetical protein